MGKEYERLKILFSNFDESKSKLANSKKQQQELTNNYVDDYWEHMRDFY